MPAAPSTRWGKIRDFASYRALMWPLALQAIRRRYRRTLLGWPWLVIRPLIAAVAGSILFAGVLGVETGPPYLLFFAVSMAAWSLLNVGLPWCTRSLEMNRRLLETVYFPRLLLPVTHLVPAIVEFAVFVVVALLVACYFLLAGGYSLPPPTSLLYAVGATVYGLSLVLAIGLWTCILGARNRDLRFSLPYIVQVWLFATPVVYPITAVPADWRAVISANPATLLVSMFRRGFFEQEQITQPMVVGGFGVTVPLLLGGFWFFHRARVTTLEPV
jgi:lipopolysaccharide transport system permease protein